MAAGGDASLRMELSLLGFGGGLHGGKVVKGAPFQARLRLGDDANAGGR